MSDPDLDDVIPQRSTLARVTDNLNPLVDALKMALADAPSFALRLETATPAQREEIVKLRAMLEQLIRPLEQRIATLDMHARLACERAGATELALTGKRKIVVDKPPSKYVVKEQDLRRGLLAQVKAGAITQDEADAAITEVVSYKPNHTKLNALAAHRGDVVREIIDSNRTKEKPDMSRARVTWPEPQED